MVATVPPDSFNLLGVVLGQGVVRGDQDPVVELIVKLEEQLRV